MDNSLTITYHHERYFFSNISFVKCILFYDCCTRSFFRSSSIYNIFSIVPISSPEVFSSPLPLINQFRTRSPESNRPPSHTEMPTITSEVIPEPFEDVISYDVLPDLPSVPPPNSNASAVQDYLITYWMWQGFHHSYSLYLARKLKGLDAEALYRLSEAELMEKYDVAGQNLYHRIARARYGMVSFPEWVSGVVELLIVMGVVWRGCVGIWGHGGMD
ncbi:MAG: hypothetical protein Q9199_005885 [Rusavskia elegans]